MPNFPHHHLPDMSDISSRYSLAPDYSISRVIKGGWQMSDGHTIGKQFDSQKSVNDTLAFIRGGITTLDFGDIYLGVEEMVGGALKQLENEMGTEARNAVQLHTKYVPDLLTLPHLHYADVETIVHRSRKRLGVDYLDLVQLHWWDYAVPGYIEAMKHLSRLQRDGYIRLLGVTNFDVERMQEFVDAGMTPKTIQLQYSVLDRRPEHGMVEFCDKHGINFLCYGTVAGGFISERYLNIPEPKPPFENRSLTKYKLIIDEYGGWIKFQTLLQVLDTIAAKHESDISSIGSAYILTRPRVAGVIVGVRDQSHLEENRTIMQIALDENDISSITAVLSEAQGPRGDVYDLERNNPKHSGIMHKHNNAK